MTDTCEHRVKYGTSWEQGGYDRDGHKIIYCVHCGDIFTIDDHDLDNPVYHNFNKETGEWLNAVTLAK